MYATDVRQTRQTKASLNASALWGQRHNNFLGGGNNIQEEELGWCIRKHAKSIFDYYGHAMFYSYCADIDNSFHLIWLPIVSCAITMALHAFSHRPRLHRATTMFAATVGATLIYR